ARTGYDALNIIAGKAIVLCVTVARQSAYKRRMCARDISGGPASSTSEQNQTAIKLQPTPGRVHGIVLPTS
ncbi:MAG TPA: hypothetical protein VF717_14400, partial [Pyrinomonadaceae bacterium]